MIKTVITIFLFIFHFHCFSQQNTDSLISIGRNVITLKEVVINSKLDVPSFIQRLKNDTTFYKAFRNMDILGYTSLNDIRMLDKHEQTQASLYSKTKQVVQNGCRSMITLEQQTSGDLYDADSNFNYYTAQMYASLFFTKGTICGQNNIVAGKRIFNRQ
ncbi:MAG: hypothetical protein WDM71_10265 [Ferruginibacter sp.]